MRVLVAGIASFLLPGYGQAAAGRTRTAIAWSAAVPLAMVLVYASVWMFYVAFALRVASGVHALVSARRSDTYAWFATAPLVIGCVAIATFGIVRVYVIEGFKTPSSSMYPTLQIGDDVFADKLTPHFRAIERGDVIVFAYPCNPKVDYVKRVIGLGGDTIEVRCNVVYVNGVATPSSLVAATCTYRDYLETSNTWFDRPCSRYHEELGDHAYDVFHDPDRPERDKTHSSGDQRDFPQRDKPILPSCRNAESRLDAPPPKGRIVETVPAAGASACTPQYHYVVPDGTYFVMGDNRSNSADSRVWGPVDAGALHGRVLGIWLSRGPDGFEWSRVGALH
jgi:signal peptidase I